MTRKLPHVGLRLPDMAERSMPEQDGLRWTSPAERDQQRRALADQMARLAEAVGTAAFGSQRGPIRVVAEVGEPIPEIEGS